MVSQGKTPPLRAVKDGDAPPPEKPAMTLSEAVAAGDRLAEMKATHLIIVRQLETGMTPPRDLSSLTRRQMELSKEIEALERQRKEEQAHDAGPSEDEAWEQDAI